MLHFTCDLCGQTLGDNRYVAKVEVYPAFDPDSLNEEDLDADHLQEVAEAIQLMELTGQAPSNQDQPRDFRFDLCSSCHSRYLRDPLGRDALARLTFSEN